MKPSNSSIKSVDSSFPLICTISLIQQITFTFGFCTYFVININLDLRIQQRNGRKTLTTLQGLATEIDCKRLLKAVKKAFACNGTVIEDEEHGEIIQLQGDQRMKLAEFLVAEGIAKKDEIKVHGF
ncbi:hypothetical protein [Parasitella parasitica]|uniref:SUI1 domain-containing protein n=1 Tax=Parasitella parasitica TaxID=35722 RepID=A0A0B7MTE0_9FUNG|nr:hypothetical protein [Parasitella parasitica]